MGTKRRWMDAIGAVLLVGILAIPSIGAQTDESLCYDENGVPYPATQDSDKDGNPDCHDPDDDNDRLSDELEVAMGLDPLSKDTDEDRINDAYDLAPHKAGPDIAITVRVGLLRETDNCDGDDTPFDPYVRTLFVSLPMKTVDYLITGWTNDNHPWDYRDSPDPPSVTTAVPTDVRTWNLVEFGFPFSKSTIAIVDEDKWNPDDKVTLAGASTELADGALSLVTGTQGHASRGTSDCAAEVAFTTFAGFSAIPVAIGQQVVVHDDDLVECHEVGLDAECDAGSGSGSTVTDGFVHTSWPDPYVGTAVEDLLPAPREGGVLNLVVFAAQTESTKLKVQQWIGSKTSSLGQDGASVTVAPGLGLVTGSLDLEPLEVHWWIPGIPGEATIILLPEDLPPISGTIHVVLARGPGGAPIVVDTAMSAEALL